MFKHFRIYQDNILGYLNLTFPSPSISYQIIIIHIYDISYTLSNNLYIRHKTLIMFFSHFNGHITRCVCPVVILCVSQL